MTQAAPSPAGFLTITLHAHLPWVINHGTWPHGMEWLHEAAAETYLPLLRVLTNLERDGIPAQFNINLSPVLLEQLTHPLFLAEFPRYLNRKIVAAREDELTFTNAGEAHYAETARFWHRVYTSALDEFNSYNQDIPRAFARFQRSGLIDLITGAATHGYLPLLGTDESVRAQIRTAVQSHIRHFGQPPDGIWIPECGYRPAGFWNYPVANADGTTDAGFERIGIEQALAESGLKFFFVDTHLVEDSNRIVSPYGTGPGGNRPLNRQPEPLNDEPTKPRPHGPHRSLYQPYEVDGPYDKRFPTSVFPRDPRTGLQVWSSDTGYPGDSNYLDFHKKRYPGGHRYWQVSGSRIDMADKLPYWPQQAAERVKVHAAHFVELVQDALEASSISANPPILCAPFDAELFGHWWFEGALWLEAVCRALHAANNGIQLTTCSSYLKQYPGTNSIAMNEGSWGAGGLNQVWMNHETSWTWTHIYPAERFTREVCTSTAWQDSEITVRVVKQLCRELLLLEASDWQFLITTGAARDYAELRFNTHREQFQALKELYQNLQAGLTLTPYDLAQLAATELRDNIFPDIDPGFWAEGAHDLPPAIARRP
ncbi:glycoside hydrolase family 57 protein [Granulicella sibirica]|uniref:Glycogen branching enzyme, GH-57-type, archaeal n=1 Tax=Granulicella sibirica TaxID=2479048 RepID=A0A4Q0T5S9_9BACT|nr:1,4-alpha-glucan branching protein domain-containing protein [Granulicella sibirica]RXH57448.1 Glycogen branching enzyme, GH-57-type, archaeal [Granulicella sibirica]